MHSRYFELSSLRRLNRDIPLVRRLPDYSSMTSNYSYPAKYDKSIFSSVGLDNFTD